MSVGDTPAKDCVLCTPFNYGIDHKRGVNLVALNEKRARKQANTKTNDV